MTRHYSICVFVYWPLDSFVLLPYSLPVVSAAKDIKADEKQKTKTRESEVLARVLPWQRNTRQNTGAPSTSSATDDFKLVAHRCRVSFIYPLALPKRYRCWAQLARLPTSLRHPIGPCLYGRRLKLHNLEKEYFSPSRNATIFCLHW